ncbi:MAG: SCP2 sterol-binding domain-containing protein [Phototrophicaceae bacterium]
MSSVSDEKMQEVIQKMLSNFNAEKALGINNKIQLNFTNEQYWVAIENQQVNIGEGTIENPDVTLSAEMQDYIDMINGDLNPIMAFMSNKLRVEGNQSIALKMQQIFGF